MMPFPFPGGVHGDGVGFGGGRKKSQVAYSMTQVEKS
jgi:hypothetical protein